MCKDAAKEYHKMGLNPVPVVTTTEGKLVPGREKWKTPIGPDIDNFPFDSVGVACGDASKGLEVIDFDLDVLEDESPKEFMSKWKRAIPDTILDKMVISQTKSGGYHLMYKTGVREGNKVFARIKRGEKYKTLIESRGEGGYVNCPPTRGYVFVKGDFSQLTEIDSQERSLLIESCRAYNEKNVLKKVSKAPSLDYEDPFPSYNNDPEKGLSVLVDDGWEVLRRGEEWVQLMRPDKRSQGVSATYNLDSNFLYVWSTNTPFDTETPYNNVAIFSILVHGGDFKKGYKELASLGYGVKRDTLAEAEGEDEDFSFISWPGENEKKLNQFIDGNVPLGLSFGWPSLDPYFVYKDKSLNFILAFEGVGKTFMMIHKLVSLATLYGKKFALCCGENEVDTIKRYILEALTGKKVSYYKDRRPELQVFKEFMYAHFFIFKNETFYTVEDVLDRAEKLGAKYHIDGLFIDPFSYFKKPSGNAYNYNDDLLSRLNIYSHNIMSVFMSVHPNSESARAPKDAEGYLKPPSRYDTIGGNIFVNRCDGFLIYHRITNHKVPKLRSIMEVRSAKVKDWDTGGSVTPANESTSLSFKTVNGFTGYFDKNGINPIFKSMGGVPEAPRKGLPGINPIDAF
jgi:hypothetical protein